MLCFRKLMLIPYMKWGRQLRFGPLGIHKTVGPKLMGPPKKRGPDFKIAGPEINSPPPLFPDKALGLLPPIAIIR